MRKLPEWLIADSADGRVFIVHVKTPAFIAEVSEETIEQLFWFDNPPIDASEVAQLMRKAGKFYMSEED